MERMIEAKLKETYSEEEIEAFLKSFKDNMAKY
jgi:hypothetical protein